MFRGRSPHTWVGRTDFQLKLQTGTAGGADRDRTGDLKLAKLALSQLSYGPQGSELSPRPSANAVLRPLILTTDPWWAWEELNFRPHAYQARALTN
jgi:hypothetical protein